MVKTKTNTSNKSNWLFYAIIIVMVVAALVVGYSTLGGAAGPNPDEGVRVSRPYYRDGTGAYTATYANPDVYVERWKYVVREDPVCNGSHFSDGGRNVEGNIGSVVYGSDTFTPTTEQLLDYDYKFICFNALLGDGSWAQGSRQIALEPADLLYGVYTNVNAARAQLNDMRFGIDKRLVCTIMSDEGECFGGGSETHYDCTDGESKLAAWPAELLATNKHLYWSEWRDAAHQRQDHGRLNNHWSAVVDYISLAYPDVENHYSQVEQAINNYKEHCGLS